MARRPKPRRGVLLLIVLSLLVLFMLVGLSFMVSASQFSRLAKSAARTETSGMSGAKLADTVLYQVVRGTTNPYSALRGHSLLEDLYGRDYLLGETSSNVGDFMGSGYQIHQIAINNTFSRLSTQLQADQLQDDYYGGCVLTYLNGVAAGESTRIVDYKPSLGRILVKAIAAQDLTVPTGDTLRFVINGRPFNGTGAGYNPTTGSLDNVVSGSGLPVAYMPNRAYREIADPNNRIPYEVGGLDESWDAVDYQNLFLAKAADLQMLVGAQTASGSSPEQNDLLTFIRNTGGAIPSFHRPFLYQHLVQFGPEGSELAASLRPSITNHPAFTGSSPSFNPVLGPWDVDNNGDGVNDSVWVDAGLSPVSGPDGRMYKPLVAVHVVDLDGRINVNAVEGLERANTIEALIALQGRMGRPFTTQQSVIGEAGIAFGLDDRQSLGLGFGPADIEMRVPALMRSILRERYAGDRRLDNGDLAEFVPPPPATPPSFHPPVWQEQSSPGFGMPGNSTPSVMPDDNRVPHTHNQKQLPVPADIFRTTRSLDTGYGSPTDLHGRSFPYLDPIGNTIWVGARMGQYDGVNDPYEIELLGESANDNPFDLADLDAIVRFDSPFQDDSRLFSLLNNAGLLADSHLFTTQSFSIPAPPALSGGRYRGTAVSADGLSPGGSTGEGLARSIRGMFEQKIRRAIQRDGAGTGLGAAAISGLATRLMAPEFARGEKLDLNQVLVPNPDSPNAAVQSGMSLRKELFARHLFNLLMLLSDDDVVLPANPGMAIPQRRELHVRRLAQWAINAVDFGDADGVMTRFRYDVNPFNSVEVFDAAGNVRTGANNQETQAILSELRVVWGMEHPELLLTETLAYHDRRAEDSEGEVDQDDTLIGDEDTDLDSLKAPHAAAFFELYCPRSRQPGSAAGLHQVTNRQPEDLYIDQGLGQQALNIARMVGNRPVWRLAISEIHEGQELNPQAILQGSAPQGAIVSSRAGSTFEPEDHITQNDLPLDLDLPLRLRRFVWFSPPIQLPANGPEETRDNTFFSTVIQGQTNGLVQPGGYVIVGPELLNQVVRVAAAEGQLAPPTQEINLNGAHRRLDLQGLRPPLQNRVPIVAQTFDGLGCNISVPLGGYSEPLPSGTPLDSLPPKNGGSDAEDAPLYADPVNQDRFPQATGTHPNVRTVFLQRLANPNLPYDPIANPYRTIDWMPIDLTVFNSEHDGEDDPEEDGKKPDIDNFASREKTGIRVSPLTPGEAPVDPALYNIWSAWTNLCPRAPLDKAYGQATADQNKVDSANTNVAHSLGWLNRSFDTIGPVDGLGHFRLDNPSYLEAPVAVNDPINGQLPATFPSLTWHNRPYANPYELLLVPATSSARLTTEFSVSQRSTPIRSTINTPVEQAAEYRGGFGHLLNFFHSSIGNRNDNPAGGNQVNPNTAGNYYRLFDFVAVPSRFKGTRKHLNQTAITNNSNPFKVTSSFVDLMTREVAISEFREPGKVNLNTAAFRILPALGFDSAHESREVNSNRKYLEFELAMAGYDNPRITVGDVSGRYPSGLHPAEYPNPLRAGTSADLMPPPLPGAPTRQNLGVDATLLRAGGLAGSTGGLLPVLASYRLNGSSDMSTSQGRAYAMQNRRTNAYFRYKDLMKLGNSVTSQSNVFAVWVTIGYFEVEPNIGPSRELYHVDAAHPDGYRYGIELGSDLGQVTRHRSFYIVDRSIPVAFEPGVNHNVDKAILVRRHLE